MSLLPIVQTFLIIIILSALNFYWDRNNLNRERVIEIVLFWCIVYGIGVAGLTAFIGHTYLADQVAKGIGWPIGSPFQREVAFANLSYGILAFMCIRLRGNFWLATIIGYSVFMLGAAVGHIYEMYVHGNYAVYNAGPTLFYDIFFPLLLIGLWIAFRCAREMRQVDLAQNKK
ncbi:MAG: hypothetical protein MUO26_09180 [Methanotrichaceae archaeon]|nr:hypothetical protein [Methanotrichaceae archaeon]